MNVSPIPSSCILVVSTHANNALYADVVYKSCVVEIDVTILRTIFSAVWKERNKRVFGGGVDNDNDFDMVRNR